MLISRIRYGHHIIISSSTSKPHHRHLTLRQASISSDLEPQGYPTATNILTEATQTVGFKTLISDPIVAKMDSAITTHPSNAVQANAFIAPASLSFPGGAGELTAPSEKDGQPQANGQAFGVNANTKGQQLQAGNVSNGNGVTPTTPAATPGAGQGVSGIVPTLQ